MASILHRHIPSVMPCDLWATCILAEHHLTRPVPIVLSAKVGATIGERLRSDRCGNSVSQSRLAEQAESDQDPLFRYVRVRTLF